MITLTDRIEGGLLGLLISDALGVPYEFHPASEIPPGDLIEMSVPTGFKRAHATVPPGTWSDDGAQALCLLDSLLSQGEFNLNDFSRRLLAWAEEGLWTVDGVVFDIGNQTSDAFHALRSGMSPSRSGFVRPEGKGNGSLMRVLPLALWHCGDDEELVKAAHAQPVVTHGHITNQVCCALYCLWARYLLEGLSLDKAWETALSSLREVYGDDSDYRRDLETTICPDAPPVTDGSGYVVSTLNCARIALQKPTFEEIVRTAISYGDDTDTNAVVAAGLAGIVFGIQTVPERWLNQLRGKELVTPLLQQLAAYRLHKIAREYSLDLNDIPYPDASFDRIWEYALTFDGYQYFGGDYCGEFANTIADEFHKTGELPELSLEELRACLFFEQRRYKWTFPHYDDRYLALVRQLMNSIYLKMGGCHNIAQVQSKTNTDEEAGDAKLSPYNGVNLVATKR